MRIPHFLILALFLTAALAGCSEKSTPDEHDHSDHDHSDCPDEGSTTDDASANEPQSDADNGTADLNSTFLQSLRLQPGNDTVNQTGPEAQSNVTADNGSDADECPDEGDDGVPNQLPIAVLNMTLADGTVVNNTTAVMAGATLFFSAEGSVDPDGSIDLIGLTVRDSNSTRIAPNLLDKGTFQTVNFTFNHEGPVNVTLRVLDNHGDATVLETVTFVNRLQSPSGSIPAPGGAQGDPTDCHSPTDLTPDQGTLPGQQTGAKLGFQVAKGAKWIEATLTSGSGEIAICDPEGNALSGGSTSSVSTDELDLTPAIDYYVMVLSGNTATPGSTYTVDVIVHHEPKPAS